MSKILIVEDDRMIAESVKNHLETWGYEAGHRGAFSKYIIGCDDGRTGSDSSGYYPALLQWILLVQGDPEAFQDADYFPVVGIG